jgi:hypothetical protein
MNSFMQYREMQEGHPPTEGNYDHIYFFMQYPETFHVFVRAKKPQNAVQPFAPLIISE